MTRGDMRCDGGESERERSLPDLLSISSLVPDLLCVYVLAATPSTDWLAGYQLILHCSVPAGQARPGYPQSYSPHTLTTGYNTALRTRITTLHTACREGKEEKAGVGRYSYLRTVKLESLLK